MSLSTMLTKLGKLRQELGLIDMLWYLLAKCISRARIGRLFRYTLVAQPLGTGALTPARGGTVQIKPVIDKDYILDWFPRPEAVIRDRYRQGAICLVAFKDSKAIGCIWLINGSYIEDEIRCRYLMSPEELTVWDFDVYLLPEYRFGRTFARLWDAAEQLMAIEGRRWSLSRIDAFNSGSVRAHQRRGAITIGQLVCLRIASMQLLLCTIAPYVHCCFSDKSLPTISVRAPEYLDNTIEKSRNRVFKPTEQSLSSLPKSSEKRTYK